MDLAHRQSPATPAPLSAQLIVRRLSSESAAHSGGRVSPVVVRYQSPKRRSSSSPNCQKMPAACFFIVSFPYVTAQAPVRYPLRHGREWPVQPDREGSDREPGLRRQKQRSLGPNLTLSHQPGPKFFKGPGDPFQNAIVHKSSYARPSKTWTAPGPSETSSAASRSLSPASRDRHNNFAFSGGTSIRQVAMTPWPASTEG